MENTSQILLKQAHLFQDKRNAFIGFEDSSFLSQVPAHYIYTQDACLADLYRDYLPQAKATTAAPLIDMDAVAGCNLVIIALPKSRILLDYWLAQLASSKQQLPLLLTGANKAGIRGAGKQLAKYTSSSNKIAAMRHCQLWSAQLLYKKFIATSWQLNYSFEFAGQKLQIANLPGVFSHGKLDLGSKMLLDYLPHLLPQFERAKPSLNILDFGCGCGVIATAIGKLFAALEQEIKPPRANIDALDANAIAISCSQLTAALNSCPINHVLSCSLSSLPQAKKYDLIVSNPPFHSGQVQDLSISRNFIYQAAQLLNKNGKLLLVANSFLPYQQHLKQAFSNCQIVAKSSKFNLYLASKNS